MDIDVFVSHHTDSSLHIVEAIVNKLESHGIRCWYAPRNTDGSYAGSIARAINACSVFLLILNKPSSESVHVLNELDMVTKRLSKKEEVCVIPFHTADNDISEDAQYYLGRLHWIDAMKPSMYDRIEELVAKILAMFGKKTVGQTADAGTVSTQYSLNSKIPQTRDVFVGREQLLTEISEFFESGKRILFLEGIGGIGKSELAKQYALANRKKYENIVFATYTDSLQTLVCDPNMIEINGVELRPDETPEDFFKRKIQIFRTVAGEHTLLIVDNFDVDTDPNLPEFLEGSHDVIITTRNAHPGYHSIKVNSISDMNLLLHMFEMNYGMPVDEADKPYLEELFALVEYHTYTIELLAKQMEASFSTGKDLLEMFRDGRLASQATESVAGRRGMNTAFGHIRALFTMSNLTVVETGVLRELSLIGNAGIPASAYWEWTAADALSATKQAVLSLVKKSWVRRENGENGPMLSLHPLVIEVVRATDGLKPDAVNCREFLIRIADYLYMAWYRPVKENMGVADGVLSIAEYFAPFAFAPDDKELFDTWVMIPSFLWQVGRFDDSIRLGHVVYDTVLSVCGEASMLTGFAAKSLGGCYFNSSHLKESIAWYQQGLQSMILAGEGDSEDLAMSYEKVARCCTWEYEQDFDRAEELFLKAHEIRSRMKDALSNGGTMETVERRLIYNAEKAEERIGENYFEMGRMYQLRQDYKSALEFAFKQEEILLRVAPQNVSGLAYVYFDKGVCYYHLGVIAQENADPENAAQYLTMAVDNLKKALESNMKMRGAVAVDTIDNQECLGDAYAALGRYGEASNCYLSVISMLEKLLGSDCERIERVKTKMQQL